MEYPQLVRGKSARFNAHLSVLDTGEPVRSGDVRLELASSAIAVDFPKREGLFTLVGSFPTAGKFPARLVVKSEQAQETLDLGELVVHDSEAAAANAARPGAGSEPPNAVPFLMEQQWKVKLRLAKAGPRTLTQRLTVPARASAPEGASALVSPPVGGRLLPLASGAFPRTGERVEAGQALALVEPTLGAPDLAQLRALDLEFDLKALDVIRQSGEAETRLRFAERERERIHKLRAESLSTQQQLDQAEQNIAVAQNEMEAARRMKASLDVLVAARAGKGEDSFVANRKFPLVAPIGGTIVEARRVQGESVALDEPLFRILDTSRIWVEGRVSEFDLPLVREPREALVRFAAIPGRRFGLLETADDRPYIGLEVDSASRTLLVRCEMKNPDGEVRPGMSAELEIATAKMEASVAIPLEAVVMDQGLPNAFVMLEGEVFQKRELELGVKDGDWVEIRRGVEPGERVVTRGAYVVKLAALSPASFGAGHVH
jgi:RND family efflux transporter MFP subunit